MQFDLNHKPSLAGFYVAVSLGRKKYEPQLMAYAGDICHDFEGNPAVRIFVK